MTLNTISLKRAFNLNGRLANALFVLVPFCALLLGAASSDAAVKRFDPNGVSRYEYGEGCTGSPKSPINTIFSGTSISAAQIDTLMWFNGYPSTFASGSTSYVPTKRGDCLKQASQRRRGFVHIKHHVRFWDHPYQYAGRKLVPADPHVDRRSTHGRCLKKSIVGDSVPPNYKGRGSGYDYEAQELELKFGGLSSPHVDYYYIPDDTLFSQCNGVMAGWNGVIYRIDLG